MSMFRSRKSHKVKVEIEIYRCIFLHPLTPHILSIFSLISHALIPSPPSFYPRPEAEAQFGVSGQQQGLSVSCRACGQEEPLLALSRHGWKVCVVSCVPTSLLLAWERKLGAARENKQTIRQGLSSGRETEDRRGGGAARHVRSRKTQLKLEEKP